MLLSCRNVSGNTNRCTCTFNSSFGHAEAWSCIDKAEMCHRQHFCSQNDLFTHAVDIFRQALSASLYTEASFPGYWRFMLLCFSTRLRIFAIQILLSIFRYTPGCFYLLHIMAI